MRRGSWARTPLFLADAHQQAATVVTSAAAADAVEVQYNQVGPIGCPHAAEGFPLYQYMRRRRLWGVRSTTLLPYSGFFVLVETLRAPNLCARVKP